MLKVEWYHWPLMLAHDDKLNIRDNFRLQLTSSLEHNNCKITFRIGRYLLRCCRPIAIERISIAHLGIHQAQTIVG